MRKTTEPACPSLWLRATQEQLEHFIYASARFRFGESSDNDHERLPSNTPSFKLGCPKRCRKMQQGQGIISLASGENKSVSAGTF